MHKDNLHMFGWGFIWGTIAIIAFPTVGPLLLQIAQTIANNIGQMLPSVYQCSAGL